MTKAKDRSSGRSDDIVGADAQGGPEMRGTRAFVVVVVSVLALLLVACGSPDPTPLEIGTAIDVVLGSKAQGVGLLKDLISWWTEFYAAAQVYGTDEFKELAELRVDLLNYMVSKYESEKYLKN